jgi:hypothetical protein
MQASNSAGLWSWSEKIVLVLLCLGLLVPVASSIIGVQKSELAGYSYFGLMISTILVDLTIVASYFSTKRAKTLAKGVWIILGIFVLIVALASVNPAENSRADSEIGQLIGYPMMMLSMPFGSIGSAIISNFPSVRPTGFYSGNIFDWFIFFCLGYAQWFLLFPGVAAVITHIRFRSRK